MNLAEIIARKIAHDDGQEINIAFTEGELNKAFLQNRLCRTIGGSIVPLSDIFACPGDQLGAILAADNRYEHGSWFLAKSIGMIELCQLGELLGVGSYESLTDGFNLVGEPLPEGPWPETIPEALTERLAQISDPEIEKVCLNWSQIDEFGGVAPAKSLADYLKELREFLRSNTGPFFLVNDL